MNRIIRAFAAFIVSICLILAPPMAYASTSAGGWTALDTITAGATNTINAVKGAGATGYRSAVTVAPSAVKVGKNLIKGGGSAALAYAMVELADGAIDWVLDPANNSVTWNAPPLDDMGSAPAGKGWIISGLDSQHGYFASATAAATILCLNYGAGGKTLVDKIETSGYVHCKSPSGGAAEITGVVRLTSKPADKPLQGDSDNKRSIPIDTVAAKVIANAEAGHAPSQEAVKAVALEGFAAGEYDAALDTAAIPDTGVENPPDTADPDAPPSEDVPFDDSSILAAIASLKAVVAGLLSSVGSIGDTLTQFYDWATADPQLEEPEEFKPEIGDPTKYDTVDLNQGYVTASGQCPPSADININFGVVKLSYEPLCIILDKLSGVIVAVAYISVGFMIIRTV